MEITTSEEAEVRGEVITTGRAPYQVKVVVPVCR
jgi:hypothetical protein